MPTSEITGIDFVLVVGFIGALTLGVGFVMSQLRLWSVNDFEYDFINLIGGLLLGFYSYKIESWPFVALFLVWVLFSLKDCVFDFGHRNDWKEKKSKKK